MRYYLGLDNGGTTTKAALYSATGQELGSASVATEMYTPKPGYTERDMDEMWDANCQVISDLLSKTDVDPGQIAGVACCGHGKGLYLWGKNDQPLRPGIISTDNRAWEYPVRWQQTGVQDKVFAKTYQHILACQPVSLLAWLKDNEPECIDQIKYIFECKDYVRFRLTGEAYAEITDYSGANLVNLQTKSYDQELLGLFGLSEIYDRLPPLCLSTDICGTISEEAAARTGLKAGTPVAGGMFDIDACAIAVDAATEDRICMIAGTWSINEYIRREAVTDGSVLMNSIFCIPDYYLIEECSATSAGNNEWFVRTLLPELRLQAKQSGQSIYKIVDEQVAAIPAAEFCPIFTPFLMASNVHPNAKASFVGISNYHTRAHIMKSVYEGVAFSHRYHLDRLLASRTSPAKTIRLAGGVARSAVWTQMFADIMQIPIETVDIGETGAFGCAMAAAVAVGEYGSFEEAAQKMIQPGVPVLPDSADGAEYEKRYQIYCKYNDAVSVIWDDIAQLMK